MNYYKQFAEMLGLELEQEFVLTDDNGNRKNKYTYKITDDGILFKLPTSDKWTTSYSFTSLNILNGDYKVVPKPWKPEKYEAYWYYVIFKKEAIWKTWCFDGNDLCRWKAGNCFKTREEAETKGKEIMEQIQNEYEECPLEKSE